MSFVPEEMLQPDTIEEICYKQFYVDFYDAFDGWGACPELHPERLFVDLDAAKPKCNELQEELRKNDHGNIAMGEHWGVINLISNREVYCGKTAA